MRYRLRHQQLRRAMARRRVSQNRWAQLLGLSKSHLSMLVNGKRPYPTRATREKLVAGLGMPVEQLFVLEEPPPLPAGERRLMESLAQDFVHAWRALRRRPAFAAVIVVTLALGIGATTAIYSVVDATLVRPLPFEDAERLVRVYGVSTQHGFARGQLSMANVIDWRERSTAFEHIATYRGRSFNLVGAGEPERILGLLVADGFLEMTGRAPALGRTFTNAEHRAGGDPVVLISHLLWRDRFDTSPSVVGRTIRIDTTERTIVGVLPPDFSDVNLLLGWTGTAPSIVLPLEVEPGVDRGAYWQAGVGRLRPGVEISAAQSEMDEITAQIEREYPDEVVGHSAALVSLRESIAGDVRTTLLLFVGAVGAVLAIGCVNVANLMSAYAGSRRREASIRKALGAGRARLARLSLVECLLLSLAGGAGGLALAALALEVLQPMLPEAILRPDLVRVDPRMFAFATTLSVVTALVFGAVPSWRAARTDPRSQLVGSATRGVPTGHMRALRGLVVAQIALAGLVAIGCGLLAKSYSRMAAVEPGFDTSGLLSFYTIPRYNFETQDERNAFVTDLLSELDRLPGVQSVGEVSFLPFTDNEAQQGVEIEGKPAPEGTYNWGFFRAADEGFFRTLGVDMLAGRALQAGDTDVAVVNETMALRFWPEGDAIGARFRAGGDTLYRIVGIAPDLKWHGFDDEPNPRFYLPYTADPFSTRGFLLRVGGDPMSLGALIREAVYRLEPDQSVYDIQTMEQRLHQSLAATRFSLTTLSAFAGVALVLALVGTYAVLSWVVGRRTPEIGIRMALGARAGQVQGLLLRQTALLAVLGAILAIGGSRLLAQTVSGYLFEVTPGDTVVLGTVAGLLVGAALLASWTPARRASRIDPARALRE